MTSETYRLNLGTNSYDFFGATEALTAYLRHAPKWRAFGFQTHFTAVPDAGYDW